MAKNKWKAVFIILMIIGVILGGILYYQYKRDTQKYDFGDGFEMNRNVFEGMLEKFPDKIVSFKICNFEENRCIIRELRE